MEHFNSEVGLGTITDLASAKTWLSGTFMFVRLKANPVHYQLDSDTRNDSLDDRLERICLQAIELLANHDLVEDGATVRSTAFGEAMARYYVSFETMKVLMSLPPSAKISEIVSGFIELLARCSSSAAFILVSGPRISRDQVQTKRETCLQRSQQITMHSVPNQGRSCNACSKSFSDHAGHTWWGRYIVTKQRT